MSKLAKIKWNDTSNGPGICVSVYVQGCPFHCEGCWNPETWDPEGGYEIPNNIRGQIISKISENNINRNLNILGGEPLSRYNKTFILSIVEAVKAAYPQIKIYLWTGYTLDELKGRDDEEVNKVLEKIDILIDGRFILSERDITLPLRGSRNQRIFIRNGNRPFDFIEKL